MKISREERELCIQIGRQYPSFKTFIERWWMEELVVLPAAVSQNVGVLQGRAQVLTEMKDYLQDRA